MRSRAIPATTTKFVGGPATGTRPVDTARGRRVRRRVNVHGFALPLAAVAVLGALAATLARCCDRTVVREASTRVSVSMELEVNVQTDLPPSSERQ